MDYDVANELVRVMYGIKEELAELNGNLKSIDNNLSNVESKLADISSAVEYIR